MEGTKYNLIKTGTSDKLLNRDFTTSDIIITTTSAENELKLEIVPKASNQTVYYSIPFEASVISSKATTSGHTLRIGCISPDAISNYEYVLSSTVNDNADIKGTININDSNKSYI